MSVALAIEFAPSRFRKVLVFKARKDGTGSMPEKWHGSHESLLARQAAKYFAGEPAAVMVDYDVLGRKYRAIKF